MYVRCAALAELQKGLFATEVGTMRSPETVAAVFDRMQTLIANMRRWVVLCFLACLLAVPQAALQPAVTCRCQLIDVHIVLYDAHT